MERTELIKHAAARANFTQDAMKLALEALLSVIVDAVAVGDKVMLQDFGKFRREYRKPRSGRNKYTNERVPIPGRWVPAFHAGKEFKRVVNAEAPATPPREENTDEDD